MQALTELGFMIHTKVIKIGGRSLKISEFLDKNKFCLLRISIGVVFFWFGMLKFFPGLSPAQDLAIQTIHKLTLGVFSDLFVLNALAVWEVIIGIGLITGKFSRLVVNLLLVHMAGTFAPLFLFPELMFTRAPYGLSLEGQYIIKNLVFVAAAVVIGSSKKSKE